MKSNKLPDIFLNFPQKNSTKRPKGAGMWAECWADAQNCQIKITHLSDTSILLKRLKKIGSKSGKMYFTSLIQANRFADKYLAALAEGGKLVSRTAEEHKKIFDQLEMPVRCEIKGNMLSMYVGSGNLTKA